MPAAGKVVGQFHFAANHQVVAAEVLTDVVPNLRLGEDDQLGVVPLHFAVDFSETPVDILTPYIEEAAEGQPVHAEEVLHAPYEGELDGNVAHLVEIPPYRRHGINVFLAADALVHQFECEGVGVAFVVQEILNTEQPGVACKLATVPLHVQAEGSQRGVLPEVDGTCYLGVVARRFNIVGRVVDVVKEEGTTKGIALEHLQSGGEVSTFEVVHLLDVGLSLGSDKCQQHGCNKYYFFHGVIVFVDNNCFIVIFNISVAAKRHCKCT